ncbi:MAG: hypothetical protein ATN36_06180 [Epulopiscium sp. Nele67-Bin005]|nr:MAG: hypothetical protein ATN36_06180 [Epulopiscium sp. Nele67-Bin005]
MDKLEQEILHHYNSFVRDNATYRIVLLKNISGSIFKIDYVYHFEDIDGEESDNFGYIYYKPLGARFGQLYMFRDKPYNPKKRVAKPHFSDPIKLWAWMIWDLQDQPVRKRRNRAEWRMVLVTIIYILPVIIVVSFIILISILQHNISIEEEPDPFQEDTEIELHIKTEEWLDYLEEEDYFFEEDYSIDEIYYYEEELITVERPQYFD